MKKRDFSRFHTLTLVGYFCTTRVLHVKRKHFILSSGIFDPGNHRWGLAEKLDHKDRVADWVLVSWNLTGLDEVISHL